MKSNYLNKALYEASNLNPGDEFTVSDLWRGYEWKKMSTEVRKSLGLEMYRYIISLDNEYPISAAGKTSSGKQKYKIDNVSYTATYSAYDEYEEDDEH